MAVVVQEEVSDFYPHKGYCTIKWILGRIGKQLSTDLIIYYLKKMKKLLAFGLALVPSLASAQTLASINNINDVSNKITGILNTLTVLLISLAVVWIIISVVRYLIAGSDGEKRKEGGLRILWGIVGLFVIVSIWGLVSILTNSFATTNTASTSIRNVQIQTIPQVQ